jgi:hypothetical protein
VQGRQQRWVGHRASALRRPPAYRGSSVLARTHPTPNPQELLSPEGAEALMDAGDAYAARLDSAGAFDALYACAASAAAAGGAAPAAYVAAAAAPGKAAAAAGARAPGTLSLVADARG